MKNKQLLINSLISISIIFTIIYLFHHAPLTYTKLITEDNWGEYLTFIYFFMTGVVLFFTALKNKTGTNRYISIFLALISLFIAAEEISWGQRFIHKSTPIIFYEYNIQYEISFHNLVQFQPINNILDKILAFSIIIWLIFSVLCPSKTKKRLVSFGIPFIPTDLTPFFLLVPFFYLLDAAAKSDEIAELLFSMAILLWTIDDRYKDEFVRNKMQVVIICIGILASFGLSSKKNLDSFRWRLNLMASRDYPRCHLFEQAESIYQYIYLHPELLMKDTRINHGKMLIQLNQREKANQILDFALEELSKETSNISADHFRRFAAIYSLNQDVKTCELYLNKAIESDNARLQDCVDNNEKAKILISLSETFALKNDVSEAIKKTKEAMTLAETPVLRLKIEKWHAHLLTLCP